ncbi:hypothetical protein BN946_scf185013.g16 [Trametes cinnabarina]|uniref:Uncharacterized protein n=1 Tax=Pycnoporus cinnabarinus TaxID=5643 RepID=A0A060SFV8_PYCCI|nr:hypothetical protein BN946_scf185013.g16 [Trametes cinnabarina]
MPLDTDNVPAYDAYALESMRQLLRSSIAALFIEMLLLGAFSVTYASGIWSIMRVDYRGKPSRSDRVIAVASTTMWGLAFAITVSGIADNAGSLDAVYNALTQQALWYHSAVGRARFIIYVSQTLIGDAFIIFRVYIIWGRKTKVVVLPAILVMVDAGLIMWRTLRSTYGPAAPKVISRRFGLKHRKVVEAILQSAAIYSAASIVLIITYFISPTVAYSACVGIFPSLIGLVFSFIVLRLARRSRENAAPLVQAQHSYSRGALLALPVTREAPRSPTSPVSSIALSSLARGTQNNSGDLESIAALSPDIAPPVDKTHIADTAGRSA